ncbi:MAG: hypothetical protein LPK01_04005 [Hymenobacteraceae bacterium]|nr:hypothetical protein [Hymenobacteraceae bacterium]
MSILSKAVARKYEATTHHVIIITADKRRVDLRTLTLKEANELHASGAFPYLKLKEKKSKT